MRGPGHCGAAGLDWLDRDLAAATGPALVFQHFPVGRGHDYVDDQAALIELMAGHDVRAFVAGRVHRETVTRLGRVTQVTLRAVLVEPVFCAGERHRAADVLVAGDQDGVVHGLGLPGGPVTR